MIKSIAITLLAVCLFAACTQEESPSALAVASAPAGSFSPAASQAPASPGEGDPDPATADFTGIVAGLGGNKLVLNLIGAEDSTVYTDPNWTPEETCTVVLSDTTRLLLSQNGTFEEITMDDLFSPAMVYLWGTREGDTITAATLLLTME